MSGAGGRASGDLPRGGAAEKLGVNHSKVFRRLAQIEAGLGSRLFERRRSGYALTPCSEQMVRLAEQMENDIVSFERQVIGRNLRPLGELRVVTDVAVRGPAWGRRPAAPDPPRLCGRPRACAPSWSMPAANSQRSTSSSRARREVSNDCGGAQPIRREQMLSLDRALHHQLLD